MSANNVEAEVDSERRGELGENNSSLAESILEQTADAVIYADETGTIRRWNHAAAALFGYSAAEALGQGLDVIIPEHLRAAHWQGFEAAMTKGVMKLQGRPTLTRATHQTGRKLYVEMTFALVNGQAGGPARGAVAVARDVTERVEQQRASARPKGTEGGG
jgi:PAS domain S-box-containing protein